MTNNELKAALLNAWALEIVVKSTNIDNPTLVEMVETNRSAFESFAEERLIDVESLVNDIRLNVYEN